MKNGAASLYSDARDWTPVEPVSNMEEKKVFFQPIELFAYDVNIETPTFAANFVKLVSNWQQGSLPY